MIQGITIWLVTLLLTYFVIGVLEQRHKGLSRGFMTGLFFYHTALSIAYYVYALYNPSDSRAYFNKATVKIYGDNWFDYFGIGTRFIDFISFFFVDTLGFTYESCMAVFSWFGYLGFLFFLIFYKANIRTSPKLFGFDATAVLFLLPSLHFWSASLGKGSMMLFGFGLFFFGLLKPGPRLWALLLGGWITFQIRPHIFYVLLIGIAVGYTFSTRGVAIGYRLIILAGSVFLLYYIYEDILLLTGLQDESLIDPLISHRASELSKATSGIDITNYSIAEKMFAFWFRPLFFDAPGVLGYIVSFENLFYLIFFMRLLRPSGLRFLVTGDALVKASFLTFLGVSFALAQISGNLGLAMRQKSQVLILMLFVILKFMDQENFAKMRTSLARKWKFGAAKQVKE